MIHNIALASEPGVAPGTVKLSWGGLIGGIVVAVGAWMLLTTLGLAVGLSSFDPNDPLSTVETVGIGTGIWSMVVSIIALFTGGVVASRASGILDHVSGAIHGAVLWSLATMLSVVLVGSAVRSVASGVIQSAGAAVTAAAGAGGGVNQVLGIDANDLIAPINDRLRAEGKPTVTPAQAQAVLQSVTATAIREGRLDKDAVVRSISANTALSPNDARDFADRIEAQFNTRTGAAGQRVKAGAFRAADAVGKAMSWAFLEMLLGLMSAILGATLGVRRRQQRLAAAGGGGGEVISVTTVA